MLIIHDIRSEAPCLQAQLRNYSTATYLVSGNLWSWNGVALEVVVDVGSVSRVSGLDVAGDLDGRRWISASSTSNLKLSTRKVELRIASWVVNAKLFNSEQVVACWELRRDGDGVCLAQIPNCLTT